MGTIRMSGMISGLDTDSLVKELVSAQRLKNKKTTDKQTLLTWKQEEWKDLNAKLYKLYTTDLSKMRLQSNYLTKAVTSSNESLVKVTGDTTAPVGAHTISVTQLASAQYVTGAKLGNNVTGSTTLESLGVTADDGKDAVITIANGSNTQKLIVTASTTLNDLVSKCKSAGLNASFDATQKKLFISSAQSGKASAFTITSSQVSTQAATSLSNIKSLVNYSNIGDTGRSSVDSAMNTLRTLSDAQLNTLYVNANDSSYKPSTDSEKKQLDALKTIQNFALSKVQSESKASAISQVKTQAETDVLAKYASDYTDPDISSDKMQKLITYVKSKDDTLTEADAELLAKKLDKQNYAVQKSIESDTQEAIDNGSLVLEGGETAATYAETKVAGLSQDTLSSNYQSLVNKTYNSDAYQQKVIDVYNSLYTDQKIQDTKTSVNTNISSYKTALDGASAVTSTLSALGLGEIDGSSTDTSGNQDAMVVVGASDSIITLDGAKLTGTSNTIVANGLTITATGKTPDNQPVSINVANNNQGNYDMVKNFLKSYNEILKEMNTLYYADSAKDYAPLSDDQKESMSDDQITKWESKIKDSILRRDDTVGSLTTAMKQAMQTSVDYNGTKYSLVDFGIQTSKDYTEKGLLHIAGDADDSEFSTYTDKLLKAFNEDPQKVTTVVAGIAQNLYKTMSDKMSSIPNVRSAFTFYNDKEMATEQTSLKKKIAEDEDRITDLENRYYKQFSAMETAMAKLQSQSSALSGLLGTSS